MPLAVCLNARCTSQRGRYHCVSRESHQGPAFLAEIQRCRCSCCTAPCVSLHLGYVHRCMYVSLIPMGSGTRPHSSQQTQDPFQTRRTTHRGVHDLSHFVCGGQKVTGLEYRSISPVTFNGLCTFLSRSISMSVHESVCTMVHGQRTGGCWCSMLIPGHFLNAR